MDTVREECPHCHGHLERTDTWRCPWCGIDMDEFERQRRSPFVQEYTPPRDMSKVVYFLCAILFVLLVIGLIGSAV